METLENFAARVFDLTGKNLNDLPRRATSIYDFGNIVARRGAVCVVAVGDLNNNESYDDFEIVVLV